MQQDAIHSTKTMTMEEHNTILQEQLSAIVDRLAETEKRLDLERVAREEILEKRVAMELEKRMEVEREKMLASVMLEFEDREKSLRTEKRSLRRGKKNWRRGRRRRRQLRQNFVRRWNSWPCG